MDVTVTIMRGEIALTVTGAPGRLVAVDEDGNAVELTPPEKVEALVLMWAGVDETGR
jgi:hypothetical protein